MRAAPAVSRVSECKRHGRGQESPLPWRERVRVRGFPGRAWEREARTIMLRCASVFRDVSRYQVSDARIRASSRTIFAAVIEETSDESSPGLSSTTSAPTRSILSSA